MKLNEIRDNKGARVVRKRVGRGIGSGLGKTSGAGQKGQKARSGVAVSTFEGGQQPIYRRLPKRGFNNIFREDHAVVNFLTLEKAIASGSLNSGEDITLDSLKAAGLVRPSINKVKLLAKGELKSKLNLNIHMASKAAIAAVEKAGGKVAII